MLITVGVGQIPMSQSETKSLSAVAAVFLTLWTMFLTWALMKVVLYMLDLKVEEKREHEAAVAVSLAEGSTSVPRTISKFRCVNGREGGIRIPYGNRRPAFLAAGLWS